jgi:hypothetical protein
MVLPIVTDNIGSEQGLNNYEFIATQGKLEVPLRKLREVDK